MNTEWVTKRLGDVAKTQYGLSESMNEDGKGFKIFRMGEVQDGRLIDTGRMKYADISHQEFEQYKLHAGDVLFNRTNSFELVGKTGIFALEGDYCFASYLVRLNLDRKKVLPEFLNYFMNSDLFQKSVKTRASKSINQANINATILSNELISFPESLPEQRRIVGILDEAFEGIANAKANAEKNLENARSLFESHLQAVFTQRGEGWVEDRLQKLTTKIGSGATPLGGEEAYKAKGISLIRSLNVYDMGFRYEKLAFIDDAQADRLSNVVVEPRDVLLNITGASVARCCVVPEEVLPARVNQHVSIIRPIADKLNAEFLHYLLISKPYKDLLLQTGEDGGSTRQAITKAQIQEFKVAHPRTQKEQQAIVAKLDALAAETQRLESLYQQKLDALDGLKKSLLHQAFSGQL